MHTNDPYLFPLSLGLPTPCGSILAEAITRFLDEPHDEPPTRRFDVELTDWHRLGTPHTRSWC